jgi:hypothetical protein
VAFEANQVEKARFEHFFPKFIWFSKVHAMRKADRAHPARFDV